MTDSPVDSSVNNSEGAIVPQLTNIVFASYPNHADYDMEAERILQIRREAVDCCSLPDLHLLGPSVGLDVRELNGAVADALVIERSMRGTADLLVHAYAISPVVVEHLEATFIGILLEDAALLRFALAASSSHVHRSSVHRGICALKRENLELKRRIRQLEQLQSVPRPCSAAPHEDLDNSKPPCREQQPAVPLHSPLSWDMETDAVINARTAYDPYKQRCSGGVNVRLDAVTQAQMVARLHDQSVDLRDRKRRENEQIVMRELGLQERRVLALTDQQEMAQRLHDQSIAKARKNMEKLRDLYVRDAPKRSLSPQQQKESAHRMHDEAMTHARQSHDKLLQEYVFSTDGDKIGAGKLDLDTQKAMAERLSKR